MEKKNIKTQNLLSNGHLEQKCPGFSACWSVTSAFLVWWGTRLRKTYLPSNHRMLPSSSGVPSDIWRIWRRNMNLSSERTQQSVAPSRVFPSPPTTASNSSAYAMSWNARHKSILNPLRGTAQLSSNRESRPRLPPIRDPSDMNPAHPKETSSTNTTSSS